MSQEDAETLALMAEIWNEFKAEHLNRVAELEQTVTALREGGPLSDELRRKSEHEAHKLAGSVGTLGFAEASRLAREMERIFGSRAPVGRGETHRLSQLVASLRRELERGPAG